MIDSAPEIFIELYCTAQINISRNHEKGNTMKKIWNYVVALAESIGRARAAAELSRRGMYKQAQQLMQQ